MNWRHRVGYVVFAGALASGINVLGSLFTTDHTAVRVIAPIVSLPIVIRVIVDIATDYDIVPPSTRPVSRELVAASAFGGLVGGGALYLTIGTMSVPSVFSTNLLYIAVVVEWLLAYSVVLLRIRTAKGATSETHPDAH